MTRPRFYPFTEHSTRERLPRPVLDPVAGLPRLTPDQEPVPATQLAGWPY